MSTVNPTITSQGGPIKLLATGSSDPVDLVLTVSVDPADQVPKVMATLKLPAGHFKFNNGRFSMTAALGKMANGDEATISFLVKCDTNNPGNLMAMQVFVQDKFGQPTAPADLVYNVVTQ